MESAVMTNDTSWSYYSMVMIDVFVCDVEIKNYYGRKATPRRKVTENDY